MNHKSTELPPIVEMLPEQPTANVHAKTFGAHMVRYAANADIHEGNATLLEPLDNHAASIDETKVRPDGLSRFRKRIGQRLGTVMTDQETEFVDTVVARQESYSAAVETKFNRTMSQMKLLEMREELGALDDEQVKMLDAYFEKNVPEELKAEKATSESEHWAGWLAIEADDAQVTRTFQWHVARIEKQQTDPEFIAAIEKYKQDFHAALLKAVEEGRLSKHALENLHKIPDAKVSVGDIFDTVLQKRLGYHKVGTGDIVLSDTVVSGELASAGLTDITTEDILYHEGGHAFLQNVEDLIFNAPWFSEANTQHVAYALQHGDWDTVDPAQRTEGFSKARDYERVLLHTLLTAGKHQVATSLVTRAYSGRLEEQEACVRELDSAWEEDILYKVTLQHVKMAELFTQKPEAAQSIKQALGMGEVSLSPDSLALVLVNESLLAESDKRSATDSQLAKS